MWVLAALLAKQSIEIHMWAGTQCSSRSPSHDLSPAGTGATEDIGVGRGTNYSVNGPLAEGMDDESYHFMFEPIMQQVGHGVLVFGLAGCLPGHAAGLAASLLFGLLKGQATCVSRACGWLHLRGLLHCCTQTSFWSLHCCTVAQPGGGSAANDPWLTGLIWRLSSPYRA